MQKSREPLESRSNGMVLRTVPGSCGLNGSHFCYHVGHLNGKFGHFSWYIWSAQVKKAKKVAAACHHLPDCYHVVDVIFVACSSLPFVASFSLLHNTFFFTLASLPLKFLFCFIGLSTTYPLVCHYTWIEKTAFINSQTRLRSLS